MLYESFLIPDNAFWWSLRLPSPKSRLKAEIWKIIIFMIFGVSKFDFGLWPKWSFPLPLGLSFCMCSLKCSKFLGKPPKPQQDSQKYKHIEKLTPEIFKMSFFIKFKTSPHLPPYYSTEPMKYALRVILSMIFEVLEVPCAPGCAQTWNLKPIKKIHFSSFLWSSKFGFEL